MRKPCKPAALQTVKQKTCRASGDCTQDVSLEALINDQHLFKARREYEQREATAKAAEAAERCAPHLQPASQLSAEHSSWPIPSGWTFALVLWTCTPR